MMRTVQIDAATVRLPGAIAAMANHGSIDSSQIQAATRFLHNWQTMQAPGLRSPNLELSGRGSGVRDPLTLAYVRSCQEMRQAKATLKDYDYELVEGAVIEGKSLAQLAQPNASTPATTHARRTISSKLKQHLNTLALVWGIKTRR